MRKDGHHRLHLVLRVQCNCRGSQKTNSVGASPGCSPSCRLGSSRPAYNGAGLGFFCPYLVIPANLQFCLVYSYALSSKRLILDSLSRFYKKVSAVVYLPVRGAIAKKLVHGCQQLVFNKHTLQALDQLD